MTEITKFKNIDEKEFSVSGKKLSKMTAEWETTFYFYEIKGENLLISQVVLDKKEVELEKIVTTTFPLNKIRKEKNSPELIQEENQYFIPNQVFKVSFLSNETNVSHFLQKNVELYKEGKVDEIIAVTYEFIYFSNEKEAQVFLEEINKHLK